MDVFIYFRNNRIPYNCDYSKYELLKSFSTEYDVITLKDFDCEDFINLVENNVSKYTIETWKLAHFIGAPKGDIIDIVRKIASDLSYEDIPELCKDEIFLRIPECSTA